MIDELIENYENAWDMDKGIVFLCAFLIPPLGFGLHLVVFEFLLFEYGLLQSIIILILTIIYLYIVNLIAPFLIPLLDH